MKKTLQTFVALCAIIVLSLSFTACSSESFSFASDIIDNSVVSESIYTFKASANYGSEHCELEVTCNGILLAKGEKNYSASLTKGDNEIILSAISGSARESKTYTIKYKTNFIIESNISEVSVINDILEFSASAIFNGIPCSLVVQHDGTIVSANNNLYPVQLNNGENKIVLTAGSGNHRHVQEYSVQYEGFAIITSLSDMDTQASTLTIRASAQYGIESCDLKVSLNGNELTLQNMKVTVELSEGDNKIRLTASVEKKSMSVIYTVRYITALPTLKTSIEDNKIYKGSIYNFDVVAKDGLEKKLDGNRISFGVDFKLNGTFKTLGAQDVIKVWDDSTITSFRINFKAGSFAGIGIAPFILKVTATDSFDRAISKEFKMTYNEVQNGEEIGNVVFSLEGFSISLGYFLEPMSLTIYEGVPFSKTLTDLIIAQGWTYQSTGSVATSFYLSKIIGMDLSGNRIPDGLWEAVQYSNYKRSITGNELGEFDFGSGTGWMYSVGGIYKNYGFADYFPQDNEIVRVQFTVLLGEDLGGGGALGGESGGSILNDNPDYTKIMRMLAKIKDSSPSDTTAYLKVIEEVSEWNISKKKMNELILELQTAYGDYL